MSSILLSGGEKSGDYFSKSRRYNWEVGSLYDRDLGEKGGSFDPIHTDILDRLPSDPFGMNLGATFTALAGWLGDIRMEPNAKDSSSFRDGWMKGKCQLVADSNFSCISELFFNEKLDGQLKEKGSGSRPFHCRTDSDWKERVASCADGYGKTPHDALEYVIKHLDLVDLLSMERVCKTTQYWIRRDPYLWKSIHIEQPLSEKITDYALMNLAGRAEGGLNCLNLVECPRITDDGLKKVMLSNPTLTKLSVPGCTKLSIEGIINSLRAFNSTSMSKMKLLRIGELYGVTHKHFEEIKVLLETDKAELQSIPRKQRLYPFRHSFHYNDNGYGAFDVEICSSCNNPKILYDCIVEGCQGKPPTAQGCRACTFCIKRCCWCGICINNDSEYEETFSLEWICSDCWKEKTFVGDDRHAMSRR